AVQTPEDRSRVAELRAQVPPYDGASEQRLGALVQCEVRRPRLGVGRRVSTRERAQHHRRTRCHASRNADRRRWRITAKRGWKMEASRTLSLKGIEDGIAALKDVEKYLDRIRDDRSLGWKGWNEVLATAVNVMLQQSTELHARLEKILASDDAA